MANTITLYNFTPNIREQYTGQNIQQPDYINLTSHRAKPVANYAALDGMGINLLDSTVELITQTTDGIGAVSSTATLENGRWQNNRPKITITLDAIYDLTLGLGIWQHSLTDCCEELEVVYYDEDGEELARAYAVYEEQSGKPYSFANIYGYSVKTITIEPTALSRNVLGFSTLKIDGIDFGTANNIDKIIGEITVYGEIQLTKDDLPACSCEIKIQSDDAEPQEGQEFELRGESYNGVFVIEQVTREAANIYQISATDVISSLDNVIFNDTKYWTQYEGYESLLLKSNISWTQEIEEAVQGYFAPGITTRQVLAMYCAAANVYISAWKDLVGIHAFKVGGESKKIIQSDKIFAYAQYQKTNPYKGVYLEITIDRDKYPTSLEAPDAQNNSAGWYSVTHLTMWAPEDNILYAPHQYVTAGHILEHLNGNTITATIIYNGENLGDIIEIETPYNGIKRIVIQSIELTIGDRSTIATINGKEVA